MTRIAEIAEGLTKAQQELLSRFDLAMEPEDELVHAQTHEEQDAARELLNLGLIVFIRAVFVFAQITPLGQQVAAYLKEKNGD